MKARSFVVGGLVVVIALLVGAGIATARGGLFPSAAPTPLGTGFSYLGHLTDSDGPVNGQCDFQFELYDALTEGSQVGGTLSPNGVMVSNGAFTTMLDFGPGAFNGDENYLEIAVSCPTLAGSYTTMSPRQPITAAPYALYAANAGGVPWSGVTGVPAGFADEVDNDSIQGFNCSPGQEIFWYMSDWRCGDPEATLSIVTGRDGSFSGQAYPSMALSPDGLAWIAFQGNTVNTPRLYLARCENIQCTVANNTLLGGDNSGFGVSLAFDGNGFGLMAHAQGPSLRLERCIDAVCTSIAGRILDSSNDTIVPSLVIGSDGMPSIAYINPQAADLRFIHCRDSSCLEFDTNMVDALTPGSGFLYELKSSPVSLAIGTDGFALMAYRDDGDLRVAHCLDISCASSELFIIDPQTAPYKGSALAIGSDGNGIIAYKSMTDGERLIMGHCVNAVCSGITKTSYEGVSGGLPRSIAVVLGDDGLPLVAHFGHERSAVLVGHCETISCSSMKVSQLIGTFEGYLDAHVGVDGLLLISMAGGNVSRIRVAHCANPVFCDP